MSTIQLKRHTGSPALPSSTNFGEPYWDDFSQRLAVGTNSAGAQVVGGNNMRSVKLCAAVALPSNTYNSAGGGGVGDYLQANANGTLTVDGVSAVVGDYVLVTAESTAANNGLYICTAAGGASTKWILTRAVEMDSSSKYTGQYFVVWAGTANAQSLWFCTNSSAPTVGTTPITFVNLNQNPTFASGTISMFAGFAAPTGWLLCNGNAISRTTYSTLLSVITFSENGTLTNASMSVSSLSSTANMQVGMPVEGAGIQPGTTITAVNSSTAITLSKNATATGTNALTFLPFGDGGTFTESGTLSNGSAVVTALSSTSNMYVGMPLTGTGVPSGATISSIDSSSQIHMSANATANGSRTLTFYQQNLFNVPDMRSRVPVGSGQGAGSSTTVSSGVPSGSSLTNRIMGDWVGEEAHTLSTAEIPSHTHSVSATTNTESALHTHSGTSGTNSADHTHGYSIFIVTAGTSTGGGGYYVSGETSTTTAGESTTHTHAFASGTESVSHTHAFSTTSGSTGGGGAHNNLQPLLATNFIIKT